MAHSIRWNLSVADVVRITPLAISARTVCREFHRDIRFGEGRIDASIDAVQDWPAISGAVLPTPAPIHHRRINPGGHIFGDGDRFGFLIPVNSTRLFSFFEP